MAWLYFALFWTFVSLSLGFIDDFQITGVENKRCLVTMSLRCFLFHYLSYLFFHPQTFLAQFILRFPATA